MLALETALNKLQQQHLKLKSLVAKHTTEKGTQTNQQSARSSKKDFRWHLYSKNEMLGVGVIAAVDLID